MRRGRLVALGLVVTLAVLPACDRHKKTAAEKAAAAQKTPAEKAAKQQEQAGAPGDLGVPQTEGKCPAPAAAGTDPITLTEATSSRGLVTPLAGMFGHAVGVEDVNGDGWLDIAAGTFADRALPKYQFRGAKGPAPDRLLLGGTKGFRVSASFPELHGRTSGATFGDLDGDGDADLVLARDIKLQKTKKDKTAAANAPMAAAASGLTMGRTALLRNDGKGAFELVGELAPTVGARAVSLLDYDGDGKLDLFVAGDPHASVAGSALLRNKGNMEFTDVTASTGLPADLFGLGAVAADFDGDRRPDLFVTGRSRLFLNTGGKFREATTPALTWEGHGDEDDVAGAAVGDLDRDGRVDLVVGHHFNSTVAQCRTEAIRVYLNRGTDGGGVRFEDVSQAAGVPAFPTKAPHVQLEDFDNDGWLDILATASSGKGTRPAILRQDKRVDGVPHFAGVQGLGSPQYWVTGMVADVDRDGRLDVFLTEFEPATASLLMLNKTEGTGRWLDVVVGPGGYGSVVEIYRAGGIGDESKLLSRKPLVSDVGYAAGAPSRLHFGLGSVTKVDVRVVPPWRGDPVDRRDVAANRVVDLSKR